MIVILLVYARRLYPPPVIASVPLPEIPMVVVARVLLRLTVAALTVIAPVNALAVVVKAIVPALVLVPNWTAFVLAPVIAPERVKVLAEPLTAMTPPPVPNAIGLAKVTLLAVSKSVAPFVRVMVFPLGTLVWALTLSVP